jgi:hypothetical protein
MFNPNKIAEIVKLCFVYMFIKNQLSKTKTAPAMASERVLSHKITFLKQLNYIKNKKSKFSFKMLPVTLLGPFGKKNLEKNDFYFFRKSAFFRHLSRIFNTNDIIT